MLLGDSGTVEEVSVSPDLFFFLERLEIFTTTFAVVGNFDTTFKDPRSATPETELKAPYVHWQDVSDFSRRFKRCVSVLRTKYTDASGLTYVLDKFDFFLSRAVEFARQH